MEDDRLVLPPGARQVLLAPAAMTRALAVAESDPERRWLLRQDRDVRRSFVEDVLDRGAGARVAQERWLLLQADDVRESYVRDVLDLHDAEADPG